MKNEQLFMMLFRFTPDLEYQPSTEEQKEMQQEWGSFIGNIAIKEKLVSTYQLGFDGKQIAADTSIKNELVIADKLTLGGNMVVKANSIDEAVEMGKNSPILKMGGTVEVRSILPTEN